MSFKHKLSRRLAMLKDALLVAGIAACQADAGIGGPADAVAARVVISPATLTIGTGRSTLLTAIALSASNDTLNGPIVFSVTAGTLSDTTTSGNGRHRGRYRAGNDTGKVKVIARHPRDGIADTADVTVSPVVVASLAVAPGSASLAAGETVQLVATPRDAAGNVLTDRAIVWTSGNAAVAPVTATGLVTGVAPGTTSVTAECEDVAVAVTVTVLPGTLAAVQVTPAGLALPVGATRQLVATAQDASGTALAGYTATWASDRPAVATVTAQGLVTAVAPGTATVTATIEGRTGAATITVGSLSADGASCLDQSGPLLVLTGPQGVFDRRSLADFTRVDARQASWTDAGLKPVRAGAGQGLCFSGGVIQGTYADTVSWSAMHDTYALQVYGARPVVEAVRIHNYGDGIGLDASSDGWTIRDAHLSFVRDDCIQNDYLLNGLVDDVFLDGCYVAYSARSSALPDSVDRSANVVTVRGSLWRLQRMPTTYEGTTNEHKGFFKLDKDGTSPRMALHDNVFIADMVVNGDGMTMWPPLAKLASCSNNVVVWLGSGDFPLPAGLPAGCVTVVRDRAVWDNAVAGWLARHGEH
ncbi:MAG TPA: Ig-like domain-containing protein [Gemmatimonadales bacterium]|nr:Ig-like domain-containing protein [Gemmatimonadales bacterium]